MNIRFSMSALFFCFWFAPFVIVAQAKPTGTKTKNSNPGQNTQYDGKQVAAIKMQVDSLRKLGLTQEEITEQLLLKSPSDKKLLISGIRKSRSTKATNANPSQSAPASMTADEIADAAEIFRCFSPHTLTGNINEELLSMVVDEFSVPNLDYLLQILDAGQYLEADRNVYQHVALIAQWLQNGRQIPGSSMPAYPAPDWRGQFNSILSLYVRKQISPGMAFHQFLGQRTLASQYNIFLPSTRQARISTLLQAIGGVYGQSEQMIFRSCLEVQSETMSSPRLTNGLRMLIMNLGADFSRTAIYWAQVLKLDNVLDQNGNAYPTRTSAEATSALLGNSFSNQEVLEAVRQVYQN